MSMVGERWIVSGRPCVVDAEVGNGKSVSSNEVLARSQADGPPMVHLTYDGAEPHIFDWWPLSSLLAAGTWQGREGDSAS